MRRSSPAFFAAAFLMVTLALAGGAAAHHEGTSFALAADQSRPSSGLRPGTQLVLTYDYEGHPYYEQYATRSATPADQMAVTQQAAYAPYVYAQYDPYATSYGTSGAGYGDYASGYVYGFPSGAYAQYTNQHIGQYPVSLQSLQRQYAGCPYPQTACAIPETRGYQAYNIVAVPNPRYMRPVPGSVPYQNPYSYTGDFW